MARLQLNPFTGKFDLVGDGGGEPAAQYWFLTDDENGIYNDSDNRNLVGIGTGSELPHDQERLQVRGRENAIDPDAQMLINPSFDKTSDPWVLNAGWTYIGGAVQTDGSSTALYQDGLTLVAGRTYKVRIGFANGNGGNILISMDAAFQGPFEVTESEYEFDLTPGSDDTLLVVAPANTGVGPYIGDVTYVELYEYAPPAILGLYDSDANNIFRFGKDFESNSRIRAANALALDSNGRINLRNRDEGNEYAQLDTNRITANRVYNFADADGVLATVILAEEAPSEAPTDTGLFWIDDLADPGRIWFSVGTSTVDDWQEITNGTPGDSFWEQAFDANDIINTNTHRVIMGGQAYGGHTTSIARVSIFQTLMTDVMTDFDINTAGTGYEVGDIVETIQLNPGYPAVFRVETVDAGGEVLSLTLLNGGSGFTDPIPTFFEMAGGSGTGLLVNLQGTGSGGSAGIAFYDDDQDIATAERVEIGRDYETGAGTDFRALRIESYDVEGHRHIASIYPSQQDDDRFEYYLNPWNGQLVPMENIALGSGIYARFDGTLLEETQTYEWPNQSGQVVLNTTLPLGVLMESPLTGGVGDEVFTFSHNPAWIVVDTGTRVLVTDLSEIGGNGYTVSGAGPYTVTLAPGAGPASFIRSFFNSPFGES